MLFIKRLSTRSFDVKSWEDMADEIQEPDDITFFAVRITPVHNGDTPIWGGKIEKMFLTHNGHTELYQF